MPELEANTNGEMDDAAKIATAEKIKGEGN